MNPVPTFEGSHADFVHRLNEANGEFWRKENRRTLELMEKKMVWRRAYPIIRADSTPIYSRKTFETVLREVNKAVHDEMSAHGRKAAGIAKADRLTSLCRDLYRQNPRMTEVELRQELKKEQGKGTIISIGLSKGIAYRKDDGTVIHASIKILKDRLYRLRRQNRLALSIQSRVALL